MAGGPKPEFKSLIAHSSKKFPNSNFPWIMCTKRIRIVRGLPLEDTILPKNTTFFHQCLR